MTPNLRYNKTVTRKLVKAIPKENIGITKTNIEWNWENGEKVYGLEYVGWFKSALFFLQRIEEDHYRLVISDGRPVCGFYIIDDIDEFLKTVGVEILELDNTPEILNALKETTDVPNTGILIIEEGKVFIYDHENYENS